MRPPRAWCLALRASDRRIPSSLSPCHLATWSPCQHEQISLDSGTLRRLCHPVRLDPPGEPLADAARKLGTTPVGLRNGRLKKIFDVHYIPATAGRGKPVPLLYTKRPLDPAARGFAQPDPIWLWTAHYLTSRLPPAFTQTLTRVAAYFPHAPYRLDDPIRHPECDESPYSHPPKSPTP